MGFSDLALVSPHDAGVLRRHKVVQRASGAKDVLSGARIFPNLEEALGDRIKGRIVCGTGMPFDMYRTRLKKREYVEPRSFFENLMSVEDTDHLHLALVFGSEKMGEFLQHYLKSSQLSAAGCTYNISITFLGKGMEDADMDMCDVILGSFSITLYGYV